MGGIPDPNGPWVVETEGDEEGRRIQQLGTYSGPIDRIALALADKAYYTLTFRPLTIVPSDTLPVIAKSVHVSMGEDEGVLVHCLRSRPVLVRHSGYYKAVEIIAGPEYADERAAGMAQRARAKLTADELDALTHEIRKAS